MNRLTSRTAQQVADLHVQRGDSAGRGLPTAPETDAVREIDTAPIARTASLSRWSLEVALLAAAYIVTGKLGLRLATENVSATPVWPPTGIALAALILLGFRIWPGIFLGALIANLLTAGSLLVCVGIALGNTGEALLGAYLVKRYAGGREAYHRPHDIFKYAILAGLLSTMVSATTGVLSLSMGGYAEWSNFGPVWLTWWLGDAAAALTIAPLFLVWCTYDGVDSGGLRRGETWCSLAALLLIGGSLFGGITPLSNQSYSLTFLCMPIPVWAAVRLGQRETVTSVVILSAVACWGTIRGFGPFATVSPNESLLILQTFMIVLAVPTMALAAAMGERERAETALRNAHMGLEVMVRDRTAQLAKANTDLHQEILVRTRTERHFRALVEQAPDAMVFIDGSGTICLVNAQAERMFAYHRDELIGQPVETLIPERYRDDHRQYRREYLSHPRIRPMGAGMELCGRHKDGTEFPVEISLSPLETAGGVLICSAIRDMTERKKADDEARQQRTELTHLARLATVGEMAAALSHELNQPLCAIISNVQAAELLVQRGSPRKETLDGVLREVAAAGQRAHAIIQNIRGFVRKADTSHAAHNMNDVIRKIMNLLNTDARMHGASLRMELAESLPAVLGDALQLQQVVLNLVRNGLEAMAGEKARARELILRTSTEEPGMVKVSVCDRGPGVAEEQQERLFTPFFTTKPKGLGMGLSICRSIIEAHQGRLWYSPNPDKGTTFSFAVPATPATAPSG